MNYVLLLIAPTILYWSSLWGSFLLGKIDIRISKRYNELANKYPAAFPIVTGIALSLWRLTQDYIGGEGPKILLVISILMAAACILNAGFSFGAFAAGQGRKRKR